MKRNVILLLSLLSLAISICPTGSAEAMNPRLGTKRAFSSIVQVIVDTRFGTTRRCTGYRFNRGNVMLPYHTVSDAVRIRLLHADFGVVEMTRFETIVPDMNVAVIYASDLYNQDIDTLQYGRTDTLKPGDPITIYAHSSYYEMAQSEGEIIDVNFPRTFEKNYFMDNIRQEFSYIHFRGYVDPGSAGGLIVSPEYEVLGMIVGSDGKGGGYALRSEDMHPLQVSSGIFTWDDVHTDASGDARYCDPWFGPYPQQLDIQEPISGGFMMWFAPIYAPGYENDVFTAEISDKIKGNWFHNEDINIDGQPLRNLSASRIFVWDADDNPWEMHDGDGVYVHFDADSVFTKRVYRDKETEERIMAKQILCIPLARGEHTVTYQNRMANYNDSGVKRLRFEIGLGTIQSLDVNGLSLVQMKFLDNPEAAVSQSAGLRYELQRRPVSPNDIGIALRGARYALQP